MKPKSLIKDKEARKMFYTITKILDEEGRLNESTRLLVDNMVLLEQHKQALCDDVKTRGAVELFVNGKQKIYRENKSVSQITRIVEQQRKLLNELKLTPASGLIKNPLEEEKDDFEAY